MASLYQYRVLKSTWGIAIDLTAEAVPLTEYTGSQVIRISKNLCLALEIKGLVLNLDEFNYLAKGIQLVAKRLDEKLSEAELVVVRVLNLDFALTDYQPEGLTGAMVGWLVQEFKLDYILLSPTFDKEKNCYIFGF